MRKAILGFVASSLPLAAMAGERNIEHGSMAPRSDRAVSLELRGRAEKTEGAERATAALRQVAMPRSTERSPSEQRVSAASPRLATSSTGGSAMAAPEIDATSAASGLTVLLGGMAVLRGRKVRAVRR